MALEQGCLVLADISGYTGYLTSAELDHAHDVLADLLETVIRGLRPMFRLAKLEGDAVFAYAVVTRIDGSMLLDVVERCYFAFRRRLDGIRRATTCPCNACRQIPGLNLKAFVHHGEFVRHKIAGHEELTGGDIVLVHRLLKNDIAEGTGLRGYAWLTAQCVEAAALDPGALGLREYRQTYEHVGEVVGYLHDLDARWTVEQERTRVRVAPEEADPELTFTLPAPPEVAWEWLTSSRRVQWMEGLTGFVQQPAGGRRGTGTVNHCAHGAQTTIEEIVDWRPFQYVTFTVVMGRDLGEGVVTMELEPVPDGTRLYWRRKRDRRQKAQDAWARIGNDVVGMVTASMSRLHGLLAERAGEALSNQPAPGIGEGTHQSPPAAGAPA